MDRRSDVNNRWGVSAGCSVADEEMVGHAKRRLGSCVGGSRIAPPSRWQPVAGLELGTSGEDHRRPLDGRPVEVARTLRIRRKSIRANAALSARARAIHHVRSPRSEPMRRAVAAKVLVPLRTRPSAGRAAMARSSARFDMRCPPPTISRSPRARGIAGQDRRGSADPVM